VSLGLQKDRARRAAGRALRASEVRSAVQDMRRAERLEVALRENDAHNRRLHVVLGELEQAVLRLLEADGRAG
jgi:hypothetical protein